GPTPQAPRQQALDRLAKAPGENRCGPAAGNRDDDGIALDDGGQNEARGFGAVRHIVGNPTGRCRFRHTIVEAMVFACREDDRMAHHVAGDEPTARQLGVRTLDLVRKLAGNDRYMGTRFLQQTQLAGRGLAAARDQGLTALEVEKYREVVHAIRSLWPRPTDRNLSKG